MALSDTAGISSPAIEMAWTLSTQRGDLSYVSKLYGLLAEIQTETVLQHMLSGDPPPAVTSDQAEVIGRR